MYGVPLALVYRNVFVYLCGVFGTRMLTTLGMFSVAPYGQSHHGEVFIPVGYYYVSLFDG